VTQLPDSTNALSPVPRGRLITGGVIFISGFISPVFIPIVLSSGLPEGWIAAISGFLAFGIPELFMIIAIAILGKEGFNYLKNAIGKYLKPLAPPDEVSRLRYNVGLVLFSLPILFGFLQPYLNHEFHILGDVPVFLYILSDLMIVASIFVLGGNFWDKLRGLYIHKAKVIIIDDNRI
jgi:hypothetical protein